jgi:PEP-CTERM motif
LRSSLCQLRLTPDSGSSPNSGSVAEGVDGFADSLTPGVFGNAAGTTLDGFAATLSFVLTDPTAGATDEITNGGTRRVIYGDVGLGSVNPLSATLAINGISYAFGATPINRDGSFTIDNVLIDQIVGTALFDQIAANIRDVGSDALGVSHSSIVSASVYSRSNDFVNSLTLAPLSVGLGAGFSQSGGFLVRTFNPATLDAGYARGNLRFDNLTISELQVEAVPEPATSAMMIMGFGMIGATLRRRSVKVAFAR